MGLLSQAWGAAGAVGGSLALFFIVALALGIFALTIFYIGSAVVILERFARVARRPLTAVLCGLVVAVAAAVAVQVAIGSEVVQGRAGGSTLERHAAILALCALAVAVAMGGVRWLLGRFESDGLGDAVLVYLGSCAGLVACGLGAVGPAIAGALMLGALRVLLTLVRRWRRGVRDPGRIERRLGRTALALLVGPAIALCWRSGAAELGWAGSLGLEVFSGLVALGLVGLAAAGLADMRGSAEWFIAIRYLVAKRRQVFISAITGICVAGIAAGVWLIIVVLSVMNGFEQTWREEILGNRAHFTVQSGNGPFDDYERILEEVRAVPGVVAASPFLDADGMVRGAGGEIFSVRVRGVDPESVGTVTSLRDDVVAGSLDDLVVPAASQWAGAEPGEGADPGILIGSQLASALGVDVGDGLLVISPFGGPPTPLGPAPRLTRFRVAGIFESSFYQYDEVYTYVSISAAQEFRRAGPVIDGIEGLTQDYYRSRRIGQAVAARLGHAFYTRDWKDYFPAFFQALKTERVMMFLLLTMIMVVAAFVIVATLIMMIMEKSSDIAILKAMGAEDSMIERIFALEGTLIGVVGTTLGVAGGIAVTRRLAWIQTQIEAITGIDTLPASVYQFSTLPSKVDPVQVAVVVLIAMVLSLGATLLPSRQGAKLDPAEGLRHE